MSPPQNDEQSSKRSCSWLRLVLPRKHRASSTSRYPDVDARPTTTTDVPSSLSCPLPVSPAQGTSSVDLVQSNVGPVKGLKANNTGAGEYISLMDHPRLENVSKDTLPWIRLPLPTLQSLRTTFQSLRTTLQILRTTQQVSVSSKLPLTSGYHTRDTD